jgi:N-acetylmuramoyl-L-alanine amidase
MTRGSDEDVDLYERTRLARENGSVILLSIHNNALPDGRNPYDEHGSSTYYYHLQSLPLAKILQQSMLDDLGFKDYGIYNSSFVMTRPSESLSLLIESGFMINPDEYNQLITPEFQDKIATSILRGLEYFFFTEISKN